MRDLGIIADGAMLIDDGRIAQVGTRPEIEAVDRPRDCAWSTPAGAW